MPIPFSKYKQIKDNYCCRYLGNSPEYVIALKLLRPQIESQLPGLNLWIECNEQFKYLLKNEKNIFGGDDYSYVRELRNDSDKHTILKFMEESDLSISPCAKTVKKEKGLCLICPESIEPVKPMKKNDLISFQEIAKNQGYHTVILGSDIHASLPITLRPVGEEKFNYIKEANWIIGVENEYTYLGACEGVRTTLVKTGIGELFFKKLFPETEIV